MGQREYLDDTTCKNLYMNDKIFQTLVDSLVQYIQTNMLTPGEVRSIAVFACCVKYELSRSMSIRAEDLGMTTERQFKEFIDRIR